MISSSPSVSNRLRPLAVLILITGLISALVIYLCAEPEVINPFDPMASKRYIHELGIYGGQFNVLAAELSQWFQGLWHGKTLAFTVGTILAGLAWLLWFIGSSPTSDKDK